MITLWWKQDRKKRRKLRNALIVEFDCRGCMAHDHQFQWIGRVYDFEPCHDGNLEGYTFALVRVIKYPEMRTGDIRDGFCGHERVVVEDGALQEIEPGLFFLYK